MDVHYIQVKNPYTPTGEIKWRLSTTGDEITHIYAKTNIFWDVKSKVRQLVWDTVNGILQIFAISRTELSHILIDVAEELLKKEG